MAGNDTQKQLLTLIREFASEKSHGEKRILNLKKRIKDLRSELDTANSELEEAKRNKENTEQELKGYEVELSMNEASIQTLEARITLIQEEILTIGSDLESLKNEEYVARDEFIGKMFEFNAQIRKYQTLLASHFLAESCCETSPRHAQHEERARKDLEHQLGQITSQINILEQECQAEQVFHKQVQLELNDLEKKAILLEAMMKESKELQELSRRTSALEEMCASLGDELQKRSSCPRCQRDNSEELGGVFQKTNGS